MAMMTVRKTRRPGAGMVARNGSARKRPRRKKLRLFRLL
jgi:hypothetical protein